MAPSWVFLDRNLFFVHDETVFAGPGETTEGGRESSNSIGSASQGISRKGKRPSDEEYRDAIAAYLLSLKPDARLADPPELSSLNLLRPTESVPPLCDRVVSACISSADRHLVALYAGYYRPGNSNKGCYLIYDARKNSLSTVPQLPYDASHENFGHHTAVVMCDRDGAGYTLAELVRLHSSAGYQAELYLWHPSAQEEWVVKAGRLPPEVCSLDDYFCAGMCFHYGATSLCWVDLLKGILVCDHLSSEVPEFRFVPLPEGCTTYDILDDEGREIYPESFRSMACIDGVIKFVTMDGYVERRGSDEQLKLTLWTLSPDLSRWDISKVYDVGNIWANETYQSCFLGTNLDPSFPVLSMHEANVVYLVFTDIRRGDDNQVVVKEQYVLRLDMENSEVQICQVSATDMIVRSQLFPTEFSAYRQRQEGSSDRPQDPPISKPVSSAHTTDPDMTPYFEHGTKAPHDPHDSSSSHHGRPMMKKPQGGGAAKFFECLFEMCRSSYDVSHKALVLSQETRRRQNEHFRSRGIPTPPDGPELTPVPYVNYEMPPIDDSMFYGYEMPPFVAHAGSSCAQQGARNDENEIVEDENTSKVPVILKNPSSFL